MQVDEIFSPDISWIISLATEGEVFPNCGNIKMIQNDPAEKKNLHEEKISGENMGNIWALPADVEITGYIVCM